MIVTQIIGGLGNQMFQYAAGRALSLERGLPLKLDTAGFAGYGLHQGFELQRVFGGSIDLATEADVRAILGWQAHPGVRRLLSRPGMAAWRREGFVVEPHFHYWPGLSGVPDDSYLVGYWQSERYFSRVEATIRSDFTFQSPLNRENAEWAGRISVNNAVSLHVRRGDYVANAKTHANHGTCSLEYYRKAILMVAERIASPEFFIFSDDIPWVRVNLQTDYPCHFITHNRGKESYNDMRLMSLCRHHIIANSSFSWWAAWLNPRQDRVVIAPKQWFVNGTDPRDLLLGSWIAL